MMLFLCIWWWCKLGRYYFYTYIHITEFWSVYFFRKILPNSKVFCVNFWVPTIYSRILILYYTFNCVLVCGDGSLNTEQVQQSLRPHSEKRRWWCGVCWFFPLTEPTIYYIVSNVNWWLCILCWFELCSTGRLSTGDDASHRLLCAFSCTYMVHKHKFAHIPYMYEYIIYIEGKVKLLDIGAILH